jgi:apolipoprotein N-acyltransferase
VTLPLESARSAAADDAPASASAPPEGRIARLRRRVRAGLPRTAAAAVLGVLLGLAFPPYNQWYLSLVAVAGLSLLTRGRSARQAAWTGFVLGLPFMLWLLYWLNVIGWDAWSILSIVEALYLALMAAGLALVSRLRWWPLWSACLWVTQEWVRVPLGGFPWGRLAFANTSSPFTPLAALGGAPLVSFAVALSGTLLAAAALVLWRARGGELRLAVPAGLLAGSVALGAAGYAVPLPTAGQASAKGPAYAEVALIQGNVPHAGMDFLGRPLQVLQNHVRVTDQLAAAVAAGKAPRPQLVIWPENSSDYDPFEDAETYYLIDQAVKTVGVPVLVGALVTADSQHVYNEGIVWSPTTGPGAHYTKQHPVPFGEYVPFRSILAKYITRLQRVARDFKPGTTTGILKLGPATIGDVICFEVAYDGIVHDSVAKGGRVLVVQTNNATYERTDQPAQQFAMSRLRAIETGRSVLIAATSGISGVIAPNGQVVASTKLATAAAVEERVPLRDSLTVADRVGATPEWALAFVGVGACAAAMLRARRSRTAAASGEASDATDRKAAQ